MTTIGNSEIAAHWVSFQGTIDRLLALCGEIDEEGLGWRPPAPDANSIATLVIHTLGSAEENLIEVLGGEPVGRDREAEFSGRPLTVAEIQTRWLSLQPRLKATLAAATAAELERERPHPRRGMLTGREVLFLVTRHTAEHLGHAELTRDLWRARGTAASAG